MQTMFNKMAVRFTVSLLLYFVAAGLTKAAAVSSSGLRSIESGICPTSCTCDQPSVGECRVDCGPRQTNLSTIPVELETYLKAVIIQQNITKLTINNAHLQQVPSVVCSLSLLEELRINYNQLTDVPVACLQRLRKLQVFDASNNRISDIPNGAFDNMEQLRQLTLTNNVITTIGNGVFANSANLSRLQLIQLDFNQLTVIDSWPIVRCRAVPFSKVSIEYNFIDTFTNLLNVTHDQIDLRTTPINVTLRRNRVRHIHDIVIGWGFKKDIVFLHAISPFIFTRRPDFNFEGNYYACDCADFFFAQVSKLEHDVYWDLLYCRDYPQMWRKLSIVPLDEIVCNLKEECPNNCHCVQRPSNQTYHVICPQIGVQALPPKLPLLPAGGYRYKLDFSGNNITELHYISELEHTTILDVSNNELRHIDDKTGRAMLGMKAVYLHGNNMTTLPEVLRQMNSSKLMQLSLHDNPLDCSCGNKWLLEWLKSVEGRLVEKCGIRCASGMPGVLGRNPLELNDGDFCETQSGVEMSPQRIVQRHFEVKTRGKYGRDNML